MTCIVGIVDKGKVYIGGDSAGSAGYELTIRKDPKVFNVGDYIIGFTSSFRMGQILMYDFQPPKYRPNEHGDLYQFMIREFVPAIRDAFDEGGFSERSNGAEKGGSFLVGISGRLFQIEADYQVGETLTGYDAVGCGAAVANGALHALQGVKTNPEAKLRQALEAAQAHNIGVRSPFIVIGEA